MDEELLKQLVQNTIESGQVFTPDEETAAKQNLENEKNSLIQSILYFNDSLSDDQQDFKINDSDNKVSEFLSLLRAKAERGVIDIKTASQPAILDGELSIFKKDMFLQNRVDTLYNRAVDKGINASLKFAFKGLTAKQIAQTALFQRDPVQAVFELGATIGAEALSLYCQEKLGFSKEAAETHSRVIVGISQERVDTENDDSIRADVNLRLMQASDMILEMPESLEDRLALAKSLHRVVEDSSRDPEGLIKLDNLDENSKKSLKNLDGVKAVDLYQRLGELEYNFGNYLPNLRGKSEKEYDEEAKKIIDKIILTQKEKNGLYFMRTPQQEVKSQQAEEHVFSKIDLDRFFDKEMGERPDPSIYYDDKSKDIIAHLWNIGSDGRLEYDKSIQPESQTSQEPLQPEQPIVQEQPQQEEQISQEPLQPEQPMVQEQPQQEEQTSQEPLQPEQPIVQEQPQQEEQIVQEPLQPEQPIVQEQPQQEEQIVQEPLQPEQPIVQEQPQQEEQIVQEQSQEEIQEVTQEEITREENKPEQPKEQAQVQENRGNGFNPDIDTKIDSKEHSENAVGAKKSIIDRIKDGLQSLSERRALGEPLGVIVFKKLGDWGELLTNLPERIAKKKQIESGSGSKKMALAEGVAKEETTVVEQEERKDTAQPVSEFDKRYQVSPKALASMAPQQEQGQQVQTQEQVQETDAIEQALGELGDEGIDPSVLEGLTEKPDEKGGDEPEL